MSTSRGHQSAVDNYEEIRYSPQSGWSRTGVFEGPKASVKKIINELALAGLSFVYVADRNPNATLRYDVVGNVEGQEQAEVPTTVWEYFANPAEIDILEADVAAVGSLSDKDIRTLRQAVAAPDPGSVPVFESSQALYDLMMQGVRSFRINAPTLRVSRLVSGSYGVRASLSNVGSIITTSTLDIQESIPSTILFNLPNYTPTAAKVAAGFVYAWYKKHPTVQQSGQKWQISQEWDYGLWPTLLYNNPL